MKDDINGSMAAHSGDINFVAALMSQGIPLDPNTPCKVIYNGGQSYGSYRYLPASEDGSQGAHQLIDHWSGHRILPADHGFTQVCKFIKARPRGVQRTDDLLTFAVDYLIAEGETLPGFKRLSDIPDYVRANPKSKASYILAYVWNRELCFKIYHTCAKSAYMTEESGGSSMHALIDEKLPKWQRNELLSRLQG